MLILHWHFKIYMSVYYRNFYHVLLVLYRSTEKLSAKAGYLDIRRKGAYSYAFIFGRKMITDVTYVTIKYYEFLMS